MCSNTNAPGKKNGLSHSFSSELKDFSGRPFCQSHLMIKALAKIISMEMNVYNFYL